MSETDKLDVLSNEQIVKALEGARTKIEEIITINNELLKACDELEKNSTAIKIVLARLGEVTDEELKVMENKVEEIKEESEKVKEEVEEAEEEISKEKLETKDILEKAQSQIEKINMFREYIQEESKYFRIVQPRLKEISAEKSEYLNREELDQWYVYIVELTESIDKLYQKEYEMYEGIKEDEDQIILDIKNLDIEAQKLVEILEEIKESGEKFGDIIGELEKLREKNEFKADELKEILFNIFKKAKELELDSHGENELYVKINALFGKLKKVLKIKFNDLDIKFLIMKLAGTSLHLMQLDRQGKYVYDSFINLKKQEQDLLTRIGLGEEHFKEFSEEIDNLEGGTKRRVEGFVEVFEKHLKETPGDAGELVPFVVKTLRVMTAKDVRKVLELPSSKEFRALKAKSTQEKFEEIFLQPGDKGGEKGFIKYARSVLLEILKYREKYHIETRTGKALAELYEKARYNIGVFMEGYLKERKYGREDLDRVHNEIYKDIPLH